MRIGTPLVQNVIAAVFVAAASCSTPSPVSSDVPSEGRWEMLSSPANASLRGIAVVNEHTLWVGGSGGALYRTNDGGASWRSVAPADCTKCDFRDVEAITAADALAMVAGEPARVYRTSDGGGTWGIVHADARARAFFDGIAVRRSRAGADEGVDGLLFGDPIDGAFCVWTSADAGQSWQALPVAALPVPLPGEAAFAASGTCVAVNGADHGLRLWIATGGGERARVLIGENRGASWRAVDVPLACGAASRGGFGLAFVPDDRDRDRVVLVGGDYAVPSRSDGTAAWSDDAGATWRACPGGAGGYRSGVVGVSGLTFLAVGPGGTSRSDDGGRTWRVAASEGFHAIARGSDGSVFACGSDGRVARWVGAR